MQGAGEAVKEERKEIMLHAKALFSNVADTPEELSFEAGDVLTILELDVAGAVGWWLCTLDGRTGIAPGNRLRPLPAGSLAGRRLPPPPAQVQPAPFILTYFILRWGPILTY